VQWDWWGADNQKWTVDEVGPNDRRIRNVNSGKVADLEDSRTSDGGDAQQWVWWDGDNQQWKFEQV
jgi:hypothetical protein